MDPLLSADEEVTLTWTEEVTLTWTNSLGLLGLSQHPWLQRRASARLPQESVVASSVQQPFEDTAARAGTEFELLVRRYMSYVTRLAVRLTGTKSEADDVAQDVFIVALSGFSRLRDRGAIQGWLKTITRRTSQKRILRQRNHSAQVFDTVAEPPGLASPSANPEELFVIGRGAEAIDALPEEERQVWLLRHLEGELMEDIAEACSCSVSTVQRRLRSAEMKLGKALDSSMKHAR